MKAITDFAATREHIAYAVRAFCQTFDCVPDIHLLRGCNATALKMIARDYLS